MHKFLALILVISTPLCKGDTIQQESQQWIKKTLPLRKALEQITGDHETKQKRKMGLVPPLQKDVYCAIKATKTILNEIVRLCNNAYRLENNEAAKQLFFDAEIKLNDAYNKLKIAQEKYEQNKSVTPHARL